MWEFLSNVDINVVTIFVTGLSAFLGTAITMIWRISKAESAIQQKIADVEHGYEIELERLRSEILKSQLEIANTFLKKEAFNSFIQNLDARLIRLEGKLDKAIARE